MKSEGWQTLVKGKEGHHKTPGMGGQNLDCQKNYSVQSNKIFMARDKRLCNLIKFFRMSHYVKQLFHKRTMESVLICIYR